MTAPVKLGPQRGNLVPCKNLNHPHYPAGETCPWCSDEPKTELPPEREWDWHDWYEDFGWP